MDDEALAQEMFDECVAAEQSARTVVDDAAAERVRTLLRRRAREVGLRIRTARMDSAVVVVRLDAQVWTQDAATMRRKLSPPD